MWQQQPLPHPPSLYLLQGWWEQEVLLRREEMEQAWCLVHKEVGEAFGLTQECSTEAIALCLRAQGN